MFHQKQLESVEYFKYLSSIIVNHARRTRDIKSSIDMSKAAFSKKNVLFTSKLYFKWRKKLVNYYIWSIVWYGAETCILQKVYQKYPERFKMCCWRRMKISWTYRVRNEEVLQRVTDERNTLLTTEMRKATWIIQILRMNWLLKHAIKGKIEGRIEEAWRRGRRRKQLFDDPQGNESILEIETGST